MKKGITQNSIPPNGRPTAREVASQCGVSIATVSRVLNGNTKNNFSVRTELYEKITHTAEKLGYRPNLAARNLVQQRTQMISFLGCNTTFGWPTNIYQPACETAIRLLQERNYTICTAAANLEKDNTELPPWRIEGVIVIQECSPETIDEMERTQLPYVVVNGVGQSVKLAWILFLLVTPLVWSYRGTRLRSRLAWKICFTIPLSSAEAWKERCWLWTCPL